eukprot:341060-Alexandrium_andersonii.AAC.1
MLALRATRTCATRRGRARAWQAFAALTHHCCSGSMERNRGERSCRRPANAPRVRTDPANGWEERSCRPPPRRR